MAITSEVAGLTESKVSACLACPCVHTVSIALALAVIAAGAAKVSKSLAAGHRETPSADPRGRPGGLRAGPRLPLGEPAPPVRPGADQPGVEPW